MVPVVDAYALAIGVAEALGRSSLYGGLAAALVWTICRLTPGLPPAVRAALWWLVCAKFVLGLWPQPLGLPVLPPTSSSPVLAVAPIGSPGTAAPHGLSPGGGETDTRRPASSAPALASEAARLSIPGAHLVARSAAWLRDASLATLAGPVLAVLWTGALLAIASRSVRRWRALRELVAGARPVPPDTRAQLDGVAARVGVPLPPLASSPRVPSPLLVWWRRTRVLLPEAALTSWPIRHRDAAVAHELVHIRRGDLWWGLLPVLAERLFFFHPLARLAAYEYAVARESACDAEVVDDLALPSCDYGRMLIDLGIRPGGSLAVASAPSSMSALKRRLTMLSQIPSHRRPARWAWGMVACLALGALPFTLVARAAPGFEDPAPAPVVAASVALGQQPPAEPPPPPPPVPPPPAPPPPAPPPLQVPQPAAPAIPPPPPTPEEPGHWSGDSWALIDEGRTYVAGSREGLATARRHAQGGAPLLWVRRDGREYVVRDTAVIDRVRQALAAAAPGTERQEIDRLTQELERELQGVVAEAQKLVPEDPDASRRLAELARAEAEASMAQVAEKLKAAAERMEASRSRSADGDLAGSIQADAYLEAAREVERQAAEARELAASVAAYRATDSARRAEIQALAREIGQRHAAIAREHARVSDRHRVLTRELQATVRRHVSGVREMEAKVRGLIDEALASGKATPVQ